MIATLRTYAAFLLVAAALATLAAVLLPAPAAHAGTDVSATVAILDAAQPTGADNLTPAQARAALTTADQVCEGYAAHVPGKIMARTVAAASGLTLAQARSFVTVAHRELCPVL